MTLIAVTAAGGYVDFRFRVVDADKAAQLLQAENQPVLVAEDSGLTLKLSALPDQETLVLDRVYFFLYPNAQNAIESGSLVTVVMGDLRLEHQVAQ